MKPRKQPINGSLDSLLDTMTNVVGILVIILVVTILGVQEAVNRISEQLKDVDLITEVQFNETTTELDRVTAELARLQGLPAPQAELNQDRAQLAKLNEEIDALKAKFGDAPEATADPAQLQKQLDAKKKTLETLTKQAAALDQQTKALKKRLVDTPIPIAEEPKLVTIPNPRAAAKDAKPVYIFCKGGKVFDLPLEAAERLAERRIENVRRSLRADQVPCKAIIDYFNSREVEVRDIRIKVHVSRNRIYLQYEPKPGIGETPEQIAGSSSRFKSVALSAVRSRDRYVRYLVWPDSYDAYLAARAITDEAGLPAGWQPNHQNHIFRKWMPWTCVPEKPLPPLPKPDPNKPKPPKPLPEPPID